MNVALPPLRMTRAQFFAWAEAQDARHEFDGSRPVAMTGGTVNHSQITQNVLLALRQRLRGAPCRALGPDAAIATVGETVRYPDALVTCSPVPGNAHLVPSPVVVFEVLSPGSGRIDRIVKLREYLAVPSILRYVLLEWSGAALTVLEREPGAGQWTATALAETDTLRISEIGAEIPVAEFYQDVDLPADEGA